MVQLERLNQPLDLGAQFVHVKGLGHIITGPQPGGGNRRLYRSVLGQHHHRGIRLARIDALQKLEPSQLRYSEIGNHDVDG